MPAASQQSDKPAAAAHDGREKVKHHIDRRAAQLVDAQTEDKEVLWSTRELAEFLSVSVAWVEISRNKNFGPPYLRVHARMVRYKKSDVLKWLDERAALMEARS